MSTSRKLLLGGMLVLLFGMSCSGEGFREPASPPPTEIGQDRVETATEHYQHRYEGPTIPELLAAGERGLSEQPTIEGCGDDSNAGDCTMPTRGRVELLALKVGYSGDRGEEFEKTDAEIHRRLFSAQPGDDQSSLREYYRRTSYFPGESEFDPTPRHLDDQPDTLGSLDLPGEVHPGEDRIYSTGNPYPGGDPFNKITEADMKAWLEEADEDIDFTEFDSDGNGVIDGVIFLLATEIDGFVPFSRQLVDLDTSFDGVEFRRASFLQENFLQSETRYIEHEVGHLLGLPDYYDYGPLSERFSGEDGNPGADGDEWWGTGYWDLMGWGTFASTGSWHSPLSRMLLKWDRPETVEFNDPSRTLRFSDLQDGRGRTLRVDVPGTGGEEFFLIEARENDFTKLSGTDFPAPPGSDPQQGLMVWHVDRGMADLLVDEQEKPENMFGLNDFEGTGEELHPFLRVLEADGKEDLLDFSDGNIGDSGDPAPGSSGADGYFPGLTPRLLSYGGDFSFTIDDVQPALGGAGFSFAIDVGNPPPSVQITEPGELDIFRTGEAGDAQQVTVELTAPEDTSEITVSFSGPITDPGISRSRSLTGSRQTEFSLTDLDNGRYRIRAEAESEQLGTTTDEVLIDVLALPGDVNADGVVDVQDVGELELLMPFALTASSVQYRIWLDPNQDGAVDERDLPVIGREMLDFGGSA